MKKGLITIIIIFGTIILLTGCSSNNYGIITDNNGKKNSVTAKELINTYNGNEKKFHSHYEGKDIEITDTVNSVMEQGLVTCLFLKNGWVFATHESANQFTKFVTKLDKGDKVHISGKISDVGGYCGYDSEVEINITSDSIMEIK